MFESTRLRRAKWMVCMLSVCIAAPLLAADDGGRVVGLAFTGRLVANLDQSVAFYRALGFEPDPAIDSAWRQDEVIEQLYGVRGIETRFAKLSINSNVSGGRFVVYLREVRGIPRRNLAVHAAWEPGATHFGLVVPDAHALWARLQEASMLRARSWGEELVAPPGVKPGQLAYVTDPDGLDVEIIDQAPAVPESNGNPARPARPPGVSHVGLIVSDSDKARAFYGQLFGGVWQADDAPWMQGDFFDSAVGGHGNILRFYNLAFAEAYAPESHLNLELVEFQNRKKPPLERHITDIGVGYFGFEVEGLDAFVPRAIAAGATPVGGSGIVAMHSGTREIMLRDPDTAAFVLLFEHPKD
jgi:catechol 2,3-dioxygenase-like lactoylglutathione lyase family enzyme